MGIFETYLFNEIVTVFVGGFIFIGYLWQRWNHRRDAANVILGEIRQAQAKLQRVQEYVARFQEVNPPGTEVGLIPSEIKLLPVESWSQYKYLFARRIDQPTFNSISDFFDHAKAYDSAVDYNNGSFAKNEDSIRANIARMTMDTVTQNFDSLPTDTDSKTYPARLEKKVQEIIDKVRATEVIFRKNGSSLEYNPKKPVQDAQVELSILGNLDMSLAILKLKRITWTRP